MWKCGQPNQSGKGGGFAPSPPSAAHPQNGQEGFALLPIKKPKYLFGVENLKGENLKTVDTT